MFCNWTFNSYWCFFFFNNFFLLNDLRFHYLTCSIISFRDNIFFSKSKINGCIAPSLICQIVVASFATIYIIVSFEPLNEFKVILIFGFSKFFYFYMSLDSYFLKRVLEDFQVIDELIIIFSFPIDLIQSNFARMYNINNLAIYSSRSQLLDFS